jgi:hypothetical protein
VAESFTGWSYEFFPRWESGVYDAPEKAGLVTVDYKQRGYRVGMMFRGPLDSQKPYTGRGWRARLEKDAVAHLAEILGIAATGAKSGTES